MTDTAQPFPDEQNDAGALTPEMQQRAAALGIARQVLKSSAVFGTTGVQGWSVQDLLTVTDYILGVGPFVPIDSPENKAEGTELPTGLEHVATFYPKPSALDDGVKAGPTEGIEFGAYSNDEPTDVLPVYPEDALPR